MKIYKLLHLELDVSGALKNILQKILRKYFQMEFWELVSVLWTQILILNLDSHHMKKYEKDIQDMWKLFIYSPYMRNIYKYNIIYKLKMFIILFWNQFLILNFFFYVLKFSYNFPFISNLRILNFMRWFNCS